MLIEIYTHESGVLNLSIWVCGQAVFNKDDLEDKGVAPLIQTIRECLALTDTYDGQYGTTEFYRL